MNNQITSFPIVDIDKQNSWLVQSNSNDEILQALKSDASFPHNQVQKDALNQLTKTRPGEVFSAILLGTRKDWQSLADDYCGDMTSNALAEVLDSLLRSSDLIEDRLPKCRYLLARKIDESELSGCIFRLAAEDHLEAIKMMIEVDNESDKSLMGMISTVDSREIFSPMQSQQEDKDLTRSTDFLRTIRNEEFFLESQSIEKLQLKFNLDAVPYFPDKRSISIDDAYSMLDRGDVPFNFEDYGAYLWG
jgi:hypothetical protein